MSKRIKWLLTALAAAALLSLAAGSASATRLSLLNGERGFRIVWAPLELVPSLGAAVRCNVTLEGSFHRNTFTKVSGNLVGYVNRAAVGTCSSGVARVLAERLPFHVRYDSFRGTLPAITSVSLQLVGAAFRIGNEVDTCLAVTTAREPAFGIATTRREAGGLLEIPTLAADATKEIELNGEFFCELAKGHFAGSGNATVNGGGATLKIRLI